MNIEGGIGVGYIPPGRSRKLVCLCLWGREQKIFFVARPMRSKAMHLEGLRAGAIAQG